jgi:hypothetical protein
MTYEPSTNVRKTILTEKQKEQIRKLKGQVPQRGLAKRFGVSLKTVRDIQTGHLE